MLVAKQPFLCQRCHVTSRHPPTVYDGYLLNNSQNANKIYGPVLRGLPPAGPRVERADRQGVPALGEEDMRMRNRLTIVTAALLLASATLARGAGAAAGADGDDCAPADGGVRHRLPVHVGDGDEARYERYRDLRNGANINFDLQQGDRHVLVRRRRPRTSATATSATRPSYNSETADASVFCATRFRSTTATTR